MTGKIAPPLRKRDTSAVQAAAGSFMSSARHTDPNTAAATPACPASCSSGKAAIKDDAGNHAELGRLNAKLSGWPRKFVGGPSSGGLKPEFGGGMSGRLPACRDVPGSTKRSTCSWRNSLRLAWTSIGSVPVS